MIRIRGVVKKFHSIHLPYLLDNTLIVLVSDHGEGLTEHKEPGHGVLIYESTMRVALMVKLPQGYGLGGDLEIPAKIDYPVQLIDVFPTVLELVDVEPVTAV